MGRELCVCVCVCVCVYVCVCVCIYHPQTEVYCMNGISLEVAITRPHVCVCVWWLGRKHRCVCVCVCMCMCVCVSVVCAGYMPAMCQGCVWWSPMLGEHCTVLHYCGERLRIIATLLFH